MKLTHTTKICVLAGTLFVGLALSLAFVWYSIERQGSDLMTNMQTVQDRELLDRERETLERTLLTTEEKRELLKNHIIVGDTGAVGLLSTIDELAAQLSIELETEKLEVVENEGSRFDTLVVALRADGSARSVMRLVQLLEYIPYRGELVQLESTRREDPTTGVLLAEDTITLHLSIINE